MKEKERREGRGKRRGIDKDEKIRRSRKRQKRCGSKDNEVGEIGK